MIETLSLFTTSPISHALVFLSSHLIKNRFYIQIYHVFTFSSTSFKVDPVAFVTGSYFTQRDFPVIVLKTLMINKDGMYLILSIVQVLFGGFSTNI